MSGPLQPARLQRSFVARGVYITNPPNIIIAGLLCAVLAVFLVPAVKGGEKLYQ